MKSVKKYIREKGWREVDSELDNQISYLLNNIISTGTEDKLYDTFWVQVVRPIHGQLKEQFRKI